MKKIPFILICILMLMASWTNTGSWTGYKILIDSKDFPDASLFLAKYLSLNEPALKPEAFRFGLMGFATLKSRGLVANDSLLTIIDFSLPSSDDRFFVINLHNNRVVYKTLVAHGHNSGDIYANRFSNKIQSHESSLGFFISGNTYRGGQGFSMLLQGVDTGYNDRSQARGIVVHAANYVTNDYVKQYGRLGRSFGCPALPPELCENIINLIKDGTVLFSYYPDKAYLDHSLILND